MFLLFPRRSREGVGTVSIVGTVGSRDTKLGSFPQENWVEFRLSSFIKAREHNDDRTLTQSGSRCCCLHGLAIDSFHSQPQCFTQLLQALVETGSPSKMAHRSLRILAPELTCRAPASIFLEHNDSTGWHWCQCLLPHIQLGVLVEV
jgi:hypothetical protein